MSKVQTAPRWRVLLEAALSKYPNQTVIQIATISDAPSSDPQPKVRSHIFRSFFPNDHIQYPAPNLPLLISSTDIRTPKVSQITNNSNVELAWWIDGTKQQFRITGKASLVPSPNYKEHYDVFHKTIESAEPQSVFSQRSIADATGVQEFWETQRQTSFRSMSAYMKASWCRPTPGIPLSSVGGPDAPKKWPPRIDEPDPDEPADSDARKQWEEALRNFALVVIEPVGVDFVDLDLVPNRRFRFWKSEEGEWREEELVP